VIGPADFRFIRPSAGIPPTDRARVEGARLARPVAAGSPITYDDLAG
jgi:sialic acid synthase SpsE